MDTPENIPHRTFGSLNNRSFPYTPTRTVSASSKWSDSFQSSSIASSSTDSTTFWRTPPKVWKSRMRFKISGSQDLRRHMTLRALAFSVLLFVVLALSASSLLLLRAGVSSAEVVDVHKLGSYKPILPELPPSQTKVPDPVAWLRENSNDKYAVSKGRWRGMLQWDTRPKAALISLVRNSELEGIRQSMMQLELRWNRKYQVHYFCDINYDIFRFMRDNRLKYGFNMNILDDARSFPSLWPRTLSFMRTHPQLLHPSFNLSWLLDPRLAHSYNNCQYFSNFEIGSLAFWRSPGPSAYFDWLDRAGGFYYERFGDAPVHTLSVGLFAERREVWYFADVGYMHGINRFCPRGREGSCACEATGVDEGFYKLVPVESPQRKPEDTCLRGWLGGEWTRKRVGWSREGEVALGGDGYGGYEVWGGE
ncbi:hypothetical protein ACMFMG_006875 [Clarireedia jacksonii]